MKVLHVLYTYYPDLTGSTIRSEGVVKGQASNGFFPLIATSPFQTGYSDEAIEIIDGIKVYRSKNVLKNNLEISEKRKSILSRIYKILIMYKFYKYLHDVAKDEEVSVIHAHSTFLCAIPSILAAKKLGIKSIYEFRSLWEERFRHGGLLSKGISSIIRSLETLSMKLADEVVTINNGLKDDIVSRGIAEKKVLVVPNGVNSEIIEKGRALIPISEVRNFAYIGNFSEIEGLDLLVKAFIDAFPLNKNEPVTLSFFGKGPYLTKLSELVNDISDGRIKIQGEFSRNELVQVYSSVDCVVIPRIDLEITRKVTPLKPLEAMAFNRLVIGSDVAGVAEVINSPDNAMIFKVGNKAHLSSVLRTAYEKTNIDIVKSGQKFVEDNRTWNQLSKLYSLVYK